MMYLSRDRLKIYPGAEIKIISGKLKGTTRVIKRYLSRGYYLLKDELRSAQDGKLYHAAINESNFELIRNPYNEKSKRL